MMLLNRAVTRAAASRLWLPSDLAVDPLHWFDAQDAATITTVGSNVSQWSDKGTGAANATQGTDANRPALVASSNINSLPALRINGANGKQMVVAASWSIGSLQWGAALSTLSLEVAPGPTVHNHDQFDTLNTPSIVCINWTQGAGTATSLSYENGLLQKTLSNQTINGAAGCIFVIMDANSAGGSSAGRVCTSDRLFNRAFDGARAFDGDIGEIIYLNYVPTQAEREKIEGYMAHRWDNEATLPVLHPYKAAAPTT